jgi:hypothetical protein
MHASHQVLRRARRLLKATPERMAHLLGWDVEQLVAAESDPGLASPALLDRCATLMGTSIQSLMNGEMSAPAVMYRRNDGDDLVLRSLGLGERGLTIGGFVRDISRAADLDGSAVTLPAWATERPIPDGSHPPHGARELAAEVRAVLGLGAQPVTSVWELAASLGVRCATVDPDSLPTTIEGLSWRDPAPSLVVNVLGGEHAWRRTRMTVVHELAHVCFDLPSWGVVVSTELESGPLYWRFEALEQRANAFAAYLLVPPEGVRQVIGNRGLTTQAVLDVADHFGVGFETAVHTAGNVLGAPQGEDRHDLLASWRRGRGYRVRSHPDADGPASPREQLVRAVRRAHQEGRLDAVEARESLGLRMSEVLPAGFPDSAPIVDDRRRAWRLALKKLRDSGHDQRLPDEVERDQNGDYRVQIVAMDTEGTWQAVDNLTILASELGD